MSFGAHVFVTLLLLASLLCVVRAPVPYDESVYCPWYFLNIVDRESARKVIDMIPVPYVNREHAVLTNQPDGPPVLDLTIPAGINAYRLPALFIADDVAIRVDILLCISWIPSVSDMVFYFWPQIKEAANDVSSKCVERDGGRGGVTKRLLRKPGTSRRQLIYFEVEFSRGGGGGPRFHRSDPDLSIYRFPGPASPQGGHRVAGSIQAQHDVGPFLANQPLVAPIPLPQGNPFV